MKVVEKDTCQDNGPHIHRCEGYLPWAMKVIVPDFRKCPRNLEVYSDSRSQDLYAGNRSPITKARSVGLATGYFHGVFLLAHFMVTSFMCLCFPIQHQEARHCEFLVASLMRGSVYDVTCKHNPTHAFDHWGSQLLLLESEVTLLIIWAQLSILLGTILRKTDIPLFTFCIQPCMPPMSSKRKSSDLLQFFYQGRTYLQTAWHSQMLEMLSVTERKQKPSASLESQPTALA